MFVMIRNYMVTLLVFLAVDIIWLGFIAKDFYRKYIGYIMADQPNWLAAAIFYLIFIVGLVFFVINPALAKNSWTYALFAGMLFGFVAYSTYDLTNLATLESWPLKVTIIDMIWGTSLGGAVSTISYFVINMMSR